jgi:O-antigen/teichoic acid export membrane protein
VNRKKKNSGVKNLVNNSFVKQTLHYLSGNVLAKGVQFIALVVFTRILSPSDYGVYSVFIAYASIFTLLLTLNSHTAVSRYSYEGRSDVDEFIGATFISTIVLVISLSCVLWVNIEFISDYTHLPVNYLILFLPLAIIDFIASLYMQAYQPIRKTKEIAILLIGKALLSFACSVAFAAVHDNNLSAIVFGYVIGNGLALAFAGWRARPSLKFSISFEHLRYIYSYTTPLIVYSLTTIILTQSDKIFIAKISGTGDAGLYSLASNIGMIIVVIYGSILSAWTPNYYENMNSGRNDILVTEVRRIFYISSLAASILALFANEVGLLIFPVSFHGGLVLIPIIILAYFFDLGWQIYGRHFGYVKKTYYITIIGTIASIVCIASSYFLIKKIGYFGAAVAIVIANTSMLMLTILATKFIIKLYPYPFSIMHMPLCLVFLACMTSLLLGVQSSIFIRLVSKLIIFVAIMMVFLRKNPAISGNIKSLYFSRQIRR